MKRTIYVIITIFLLLLAISAGTGAYNYKSHRTIAAEAFHALAVYWPDEYKDYLSLKGYSTEVRSLRLRPASFYQLDNVQMTVDEAPEVDNYNDVELVQVKSRLDNPHIEEDFVVNDTASFSYGARTSRPSTTLLTSRRAQGSSTITTDTHSKEDLPNTAAIKRHRMQRLASWKKYSPG